MEIERKYLIEKEQLPKNLSDYPFHRIEQGYLCTSPVVRTADRMMNIFSHTNQKASWPEKNIIFH